MTKKNDGLHERQLSLAVREAFKQLLKDIESEPGLILEGDSQLGTEETTVTREISSWLFRRRDGDDGTDNNTDNKGNHGWIHGPGGKGSRI